MSAVVYALAAVWSFVGGADVFIEADGGPMLCMYHERDYSSVDIRWPVMDPQTGGFAYQGSAEFSVARLKCGDVVIQRSWWLFAADDDGKLSLEQEWWQFVVWFGRTQ